MEVVDKTCVLCRKDTENDLLYGQILYIDYLYVHHFCLIFSKTSNYADYYFFGEWTSVYANIVNEQKTHERDICCFCNRNGANLVCSGTTCHKTFHLPCGIENKVLLDFNKMQCFCETHRKQSNVPASIQSRIDEHRCIICLENFQHESDDLIIWSSCCRGEILFHAQCIKPLALNGADSLKCPGCNNRNRFRHCIQAYGVYIPSRKSSWESYESGVDLDNPVIRCDAPECRCPQGRASNTESWPLTVCRSCGSFGIHMQCTTFQDQYTCTGCSFRVN